MRQLSLLISLLVLFSGCEMQSLLIKPELPLIDEGKVYLYLQPFPKEAERLRFRTDQIHAIKSDNSEYPLSLVFSELKGNDFSRQRFFASGQLPPGDYIGLSIKVGKAFLAGEEGDSELLVPDDPVKLELPFRIDVRKGIVISMTFRYSESVREGFSFYPSFSIMIPHKPLLGLTGYVTNHDSNNITVFDKKSGEVRDIIETGRGPRGIVIDKASRRAYVVLSDEDAVEVIDIISGNIIRKLLLNSGDRPKELALTSNGSLLIVINNGSDSVSIIDTFSLIEERRLNVGDGPNSMILDRTGRKAYIFNSFSNTISVIDVPTRSLSVTVATESAPLRGQFNTRGDKLFVFYERSPYLTVFDPFTLSVTKRVYVGEGVSSLKVDTRNDMLYLSRSYDSFIEMYDPFSIMPGEIFNVGGGVRYMTIDNDENTLCVLIPDKRKLVIVNLVSKNIISEMDVGTDPYWVTIMEER